MFCYRSSASTNIIIQKKSVVLELVTILAETHPDNNTALAVYGEMLNHNQEHEKH